MLALVRQAFDGRYQVESEIGRGGNARIFLARDPEGRQVALKILHPELLVSVAADRFLREIKLASQLSHPHIARLLDSGERDWLVYYVMDFVDGQTLRERLDSSRQLSIGETLRIAIRSAGCARSCPPAGHHSPGRQAGQRGAVGAGGNPAGLRHCPGGRCFGSPTSSTRSGIAVGTSTYMSPEQITAVTDIDHRCDLYSMGCVLYECLAGQAPYVHRNEAVVLQLHLTQPAPDVRTLRGDTPPELATAIAKAMAKAPRPIAGARRPR